MGEHDVDHEEPAGWLSASGHLTTYDILPSAEAERPPRRGIGRWTIAGVLAVVAAVLVGTVVVGLQVLSGGGTQPEDLVPATAFAFAKVDLDPSAGQKLDAVRFLRSFPQLKASVHEGADLREAFFDATAPSASRVGIDFRRDVEPWLGSRIGVAALPPATTGRPPVLLGVLQVRDEAKARATLARLRSTSSLTASGGFVVQDGWAALAPTDAEARAALASAAKAPLAAAPHFAADLKRLGEDGILTAWVDAGAASGALGRAGAASALGRAGAASALGGLGGLGGGYGLGPLGRLGFGLGSSAQASGRVVYAVRFAGPKVLEVTGFATGTGGTRTDRAPLRQLGTLPATTVAAVGVSGLDAITDTFWSQLRATAAGAGGARELDQTVRVLRTRYGIALPADLKTLLGSETTLALDSTGLSFEAAPRVGVRAVTDPAGGTALAQKLARAAGEGAPVRPTVRRTADGYVLATTADQAARMSVGGTLGARGDFTAALPDVGSAQVAVFVDVDGLVTGLAPGDHGSVTQALREIDALGFTAAVEGDSATYRVRLVVH